MRDRALTCATPQNLFPVQIENVLTAHEAIVEAAVVAVPDARYGELVGEWIVRDPHRRAVTREEVRSAVASNMNPQVRAACSVLRPTPSISLSSRARPRSDFWCTERAGVGLVCGRGRRGGAAEDREWESDEACVAQVEQDACGEGGRQGPIVRLSGPLRQISLF